jgi:serine protease
VTATWRRLAAAAAIGGGLAILAAIPAAATGSAGAAGASRRGVVYGNGRVHVLHLKASGPLSSGNNLAFQGGSVETAPGVYIVYWGWTSDPSGQAAYQESFFNGVGGSTWINSQSQYCENVAFGTTDCTTDPNAIYVGNPGGQLLGTWYDNSDPVPSTIGQNDLAQEAVNAAGYFGNLTPDSNANVQYIIDTPTGNSTPGFGSQFCAWHSSTSSSYGTIAYTNFPYQTDAGYSCGQNFVNGGSAGTLDGVSIVGGHEYAESITDPFPSSGWVDAGGYETGDKCAWISSGQGASTDISLPTGTFAVQSLWSNDFSGGSGGCVVYYADASNQY